MFIAEGILYRMIDAGFDKNQIRSIIVNETDDKGVEYVKTVNYIPNMVRISSYIDDMIINENKSIRRLICYIKANLRYNYNYLSLNATAIAKEYGDCNTNITKAIKHLVKKDVIRKLSDYIPNKILPKNTYVVNHNHIYNGNFNYLVKVFAEQKRNSIFSNKIIN